MRKQQRHLTFFVALAIIALSNSYLSAAGPAGKISSPDFTQGGSIPESATHDWNLGPTGARGWMYSNKMETSEARQIAITKVEKGSPADGVLVVGDVILGIAEQPFSYDPRTELGKAISKAEARRGRLSLLRWRNGETDQAIVQLSALGAYSNTAPFDCPKSKKILQQGCQALAEKMSKPGYRDNPIVSSLNALALLASGNSEYLPIVRKQVEKVSQFSDLERKSLHCWFYGYINMLIAEYTMASGDRTFLPDLERITMEIANGQSEVGSWGHKFIQQENGRLSGYGMMNAPGLPLTVSLVLAREAGVSNPKLDEAIAKSQRLIRFYIDKGSVPYGDHAPWIKTHEDNGKNGVAALMFNLLGNAPEAEYFSRMSIASHGNERDQGHTGNYFNILWALPGVSQSGPQATGAWLNEFGWYYDLARRWDGTYVHQGPPQARPDSYRNWDSTGAFLLAYALPLKNIYLTGKKKPAAPQINAATAKSLVADGRGWSNNNRTSYYAKLTDEQIFDRLSSWSPVVRQRAAIALGDRPGNPVPRLLKLLDSSSLHARYGACEAIIQLKRDKKKHAAAAVSPLHKTLSAKDLWLRIKAVEALSSIGKPAMSTLPDILKMFAHHDRVADPRDMQQRYLSFALFNGRGGMLSRSLEGVDLDLLYAAVRSGLQNEDGRARGSIASVYRKLTYEQIEPLLPAIYQAVIEPAPSGIMFADGIRLSGLEILAKHQIEEGLPLCISLVDPTRWGLKNRAGRSLKILRLYGGAAKSEIPRLQELEKQLFAKGWKPEQMKSLDIPGIIKQIEEDEDLPALRSLNLPGAETAAR